KGPSWLLGSRPLRVRHRPVVLPLETEKVEERAPEAIFGGRILVRIVRLPQDRAGHQQDDANAAKNWPHEIRLLVLVPSPGTSCAWNPSWGIMQSSDRNRPWLTKRQKIGNHRHPARRRMHTCFWKLGKARKNASATWFG